MAVKTPLMKSYGGGYQGTGNSSSLNIPQEPNYEGESVETEPKDENRGLLGGAFRNMGKGGFRDLFARMRDKPDASKNQGYDSFGDAVSYPSEEEMAAMDEGFDAANFDPSDENQVMDLQARLGVTVDGMFGPETEGAYRDMINSQRMSEGKDAYKYDDNEGTATNSQGQGVSEEKNPLFSAYSFDPNFANKAAMNVNDAALNFGNQDPYRFNKRALGEE